MRLHLLLLLLLNIAAFSVHAQKTPSPSLNIGDPAPPLRVRQWLKGTPVQRLKKGRVYVIEFWATWCHPCIKSMPHLSGLAGKYKNTVTIIGMDVYENKTTSLKKVKAFVDSMGYQMDYTVAAEDGHFMEGAWIDRSGEKGIPKSFVVDAKGKLAWIGHPHELDKVLPAIANGTWNNKEALDGRNTQRHLEALDEEVPYKLAGYGKNPLKPEDPGKPDSILLVIDEMVKNEPGLKYASCTAANTFSALLQTNPHKAYEYGKEMLKASTFDNSLAYIIVGNIKSYPNKTNLPNEIYRLGIEACQQDIDATPEFTNLPKNYRQMAEWYRHLNNNSAAMAAEQKAVQAQKGETVRSRVVLPPSENRLQQFRN